MASQQIKDLYVSCTFARVVRDGETPEQATADIAARKAKADAVLKLLADTGQLGAKNICFQAKNLEPELIIIQNSLRIRFYKLRSHDDLNGSVKDYDLYHGGGFRKWPPVWMRSH